MWYRYCIWIWHSLRIWYSVWTLRVCNRYSAVFRYQINQPQLYKYRGEIVEAFARRDDLGAVSDYFIPWNGRCL